MKKERRPRLRELGIHIGSYPTGPHNAITDVHGVEVGHCTIIHDEPTTARTGVTVILPRGQQTIDFNPVAAGIFSFSGFGEMTGWAVIDEFGLLYSPIGLTGTTSVGAVHEALSTDELGLRLPMVAETYDGFLNDAAAFHVRPEHVKSALAAATTGPIAEGNVGGGTGMICHGFKGGIGTASRRVPAAGHEYTLGTLVQANYGRREQLRVAGCPIGAWIDAQHTPTPARNNAPPATASSSIIIFLATDAPLLPTACRRLAKRATVGLARVGGTGHDGSGDIFLAFATGNDWPVRAQQPTPLQSIPHYQMNPLFDAAAEAVEEAILNALCAAETMSGKDGAQVYELPLDRLHELWERWNERRPQPGNSPAPES
ncbi:MAG: P1 family peptidase [Chloroflexi bacterium]|nr:P1 family peptidase [Chloroflexota bacterium]